MDRAWNNRMTPLPRLTLVALAACATAKPADPVIAHAPPHPPLVIPKDPMLIELVAEPSTSLVLASGVTAMGVRFRITAKAPADTRHVPINLGLVLDTSGSMEGPSIEAVRASAHQLVDKLSDGDRLSIVAFDSSARILVPSIALSPANRARVADAIDHLEARGTTALFEGLAQGFSEVFNHRFPDGINRVVLVSDGVPNTSASLPNVVNQFHSYGVSITTLGLGIDYDTQLMTDLARQTGGTFTYIEKPEQVAKVFDEELAKLTTVVGRNLRLTVQPGPGVAIVRGPAMQALPNGSFDVPIGDLSAGDTRDIMIPMAVTARGEGAHVELVQGTLGFDDVIGGSGRQQREAYVGVRASVDVAQLRTAVNVELEAARVHTLASFAILEAMNLARNGAVDAARQQIARATLDVREALDRTHDASLQKMLDELAAALKQIAQIVPPPRPAAMVKPTAPQPAVAPPSVEPALRAMEQRAQDSVQGVPPRPR
jgi:Ca-activated chloride channel family protein